MPVELTPADPQGPPLEPPAWPPDTHHTAVKPMTRREKSLWLAGVIGIVVVMYLALVLIPFHIFGARLVIAEVLMPEENIQPNRPFEVGAIVQNDRWGTGEGFLLLVIDGETEIEGPSTVIPGREQAELFVTATLDTGPRSAALVLYDAENNERVAIAHGVHLAVGSLPVRLVKVEYSPTVLAGETLTLRLTAIVDRDRHGVRKPYEVIPVAIVYDEDGKRPRETDGVEFITRGETNVLTLDVPTKELAPGRYRFSAGLYDPEAKRRVGMNLTRKFFTVTKGREL